MKLSDLINLGETQRYVSKYPEDHGIVNIKYLEKNGKHIGNQDGKEIYSTTHTSHGRIYHFYGIKTDDAITSIIILFPVNIKNTEYNMVDTVYALPKYRSFNDIRRLLWFVKTFENKSLISNGTESQAAGRFIDALFKTKSLNPKWLNITTGDIEDYDPSSTDKYTVTSNKTDWRLIAESAEFDTILSSDELRFKNTTEGPILHGVPIMFPDDIY